MTPTSSSLSEPSRRLSADFYVLLFAPLLWPPATALSNQRRAML